MKTFSDETRRRMSESAKQRCESAAWKEQTARYWKPFCSGDDLRHDYVTLGMSQVEIVAKYGVTLKRVQTAMRRYGIPIRPQIKRNQRGPANHMWKGSTAGYQALHIRVEVERGTPRSCDWCGISDPTKRYEWANLSGDYANVNDYARLCKSCHATYDAARRRETGERTSPRRGGDAQCPQTD